MDGGAWWAAVHGVAKSRTQLSDFPFTFHFHSLEKEMATHSSVLAWRIPRTGEPGGLLSLGSHRVGHDWSDLAAAAAVLNFEVGVVTHSSILAWRIPWTGKHAGYSPWGHRESDTNACLTFSLFIINWHYICGFISGLIIVLLIYLCVFMPVPYCFNYYSFEIHFVIRKHISSFVFSRLLWLFGVFCGSIQILWLFELFIWIMSMEFWYWLHWACWLLCVVWTI